MLYCLVFKVKKKNNRFRELFEKIIFLFVILIDFIVIKSTAPSKPDSDNMLNKEYKEIENI